jgi:SAM-dependent methyltransferase
VSLDTLAAGARLFYGEFAWAYDHLVVRPVAEECAGMAAMLGRRGVGPGARLLDAGCGTGRYAVELARRGFVVTSLDRSPALLREAQARARAAGPGLRVTLEIGDLLALPAGAGYDAIVCRGVLNELVEDEARAGALRAFARARRPHGAVLLDVRDWDGTVARKTAEPVSEKRVSTPRRRLAFRSESRLDPVPAAGRRRALVGGGVLHRAEAGGAQPGRQLLAGPAPHDEIVGGGRVARLGGERVALRHQQPPGGRIVAAASLDLAVPGA